MESPFLKPKKLLKACRPLLPDNAFFVCIGGKYIFPIFGSAGNIRAVSAAFVFHKPNMTECRQTWPQFLREQAFSFPLDEGPVTLDDGTKIVRCDFELLDEYSEAAIHFQMQMRKLMGNGDR